ncbi:hypothetical protein HMPREF9374_0259 [Desmospora sp. 8437]|nr:hypothetical protein HMPREF9374_0259 [Desmospora sp. 8437]
MTSSTFSKPEKANPEKGDQESRDPRSPPYLPATVFYDEIQILFHI